MGSSGLQLLIPVIYYMILLTNDVAAITIENFYPYGLSAGDNLLKRTLDGSSPNIILPTQFNFFGQYFKEIFVSWTTKCNLKLYM